MIIDHILLKTKNLAKMVEFFEQVLDIKKGSRPDFKFPGAWLWKDNRPLVHLSEIDDDNNEQHQYLPHQSLQVSEGTGVIDHIAFSGENYEAFIVRLKRYHIEYVERVVPLTNEQQVFIQGPENLNVEVQFAHVKEGI